MSNLQAGLITWKCESLRPQVLLRGEVSHKDLKIDYVEAGGVRHSPEVYIIALGLGRPSIENKECK